MTQPVIVNGYCTLDELRASFAVTLSTDVANDVSMADAISSVSRLIDKHTDRFFYANGTTGTPVARYYTPRSGDTILVDDLVSATEVAVDSSYNQTWSTIFATTDFMYEPINNQPKGEPFTSIVAVGRYSFPVGFRQSVRIKGIWGWEAVPEQVRQACLMQSSRIFFRNSSPFGIAGTPEIGVVRLSNKLDADVQVMLSGFCRVGGMAY